MAIFLVAKQELAIVRKCSQINMDEVFRRDSINEMVWRQRRYWHIPRTSLAQRFRDLTICEGFIDFFKSLLLGG